MAKYLGNDMLLNLQQGGTVTPIGGSAEDSISWSNAQVEVTDKSTNRWKDLLSAGERTCSITTTGFITDDTAFETMRQAANTDLILTFRFLWGNSVIVEGDFHIDSFEATGAYGDAQGFSATLSSDGEPMQGIIPDDFLTDEDSALLTTEDGLLLQGNY